MGRYKKLSAYIYSVLVYNDELRVFGKRLKSAVSMTTPARKTVWTFIQVIYVLSSVLQFRVTRGKIVLCYSIWLIAINGEWHIGSLQQTTDEPFIVLAYNWW